MPERPAAPSIAEHDGCAPHSAESPSAAPCSKEPYSWQRSADLRRGWSLLFFGVLAAKLSAAVLLAHLLGEDPSAQRMGLFLAWKSGDTFSYVQPVKNLLFEGSYYWYNGETRVYAGRLPHYGLLYGLLAVVLGWSGGAEALAVLQIVADAGAVVALVAVTLRLTRSRPAAAAAAVVGTVSLQASEYTIRLVPESLAISTTAFLLLASERARVGREPRDLLWVGFLGAALVALRPYMFPLAAILIVHLVLRHRDGRRSGASAAALRVAALAVLPLLCLFGPWVVRNAVVLGRFVPLQEDMTAGYNFGDAWLAYRRYLGAWGGSAVWWDKRSAGCYFEPHSGYPCEFALPPEAMAPSYGRSDVESARELLIASRRKKRLVPAATASFDRLRRAYRRDRPIQFWVGAPFRLARTMLFHSGSYFLPIAPHDPSVALRLLKVIQSAIYYFLLACGLAGSAVLAKRSPAAWLQVALPVYLILLFGWILRFVEFRYFDLAWPTLVLGAGLVAAECTQWAAGSLKAGVARVCGR